MNSYQIKFLTALCKNSEGKFLKYRKIKNDKTTLRRFANFCLQRKILYANFYDKDTKNYVGRKYYYQISKD